MDYKRGDDERIFSQVDNPLPTDYNISMGDENGIIVALSEDRLSTNTFLIMDKIARDEQIFRLLMFLEDPFNDSLENRLVLDSDVINAKEIFDNKLIMSQEAESKYTRIKPAPFFPEAQSTEGCFVRVYYAQSFDSTLTGGEVYIDIICSYDWWMVNDSTHYNALIRPYAIATRIARLLEFTPSTRIGNVIGMKMFNVNKNFYCLRVNYDTMSNPKTK